MLNKKADNIFDGYKKKVQSSVYEYNARKSMSPNQSSKALARKIWREGILAEIWGIIATNLNPSGVDHLENWRNGL